MLGALARGNQAGVHRGLVELLFHDRLAFLDDAGDAVTVLALHLLVEAGKHLLQAADLATRFLEMRLECVAQFLRCGSLRQLGQGLRQLLLGVIGITKFIQECVVQSSSSCHGGSLLELSQIG